MGSDTKASKGLIERVKQSCVANMQATTDISKDYSSFAEAMEELKLWDWFDNNVMVIATAQQANIDLYKVLHKSHHTPKHVKDVFTWSKNNGYL